MGVRTTDPETSHQANEANKGIRLTQRDLIVQALHEHGPMIAHELERVTEIAYSSLTPRLPELVEMDLIEDSGLCRETGKGCDAIVWRLTSEAREVFNHGERPATKISKKQAKPSARALLKRLTLAILELEGPEVEELTPILEEVVDSGYCG